MKIFFGELVYLNWIYLFGKKKIVLYYKKNRKKERKRRKMLQIDIYPCACACVRVRMRMYYERECELFWMVSWVNKKYVWKCEWVSEWVNDLLCKRLKCVRVCVCMYLSVCIYLSIYDVMLCFSFSLFSMCMRMNLK